MLDGQQARDAARILVVDDEEVICDILRDFLEYEGFVVTTAGSGEDAVKELERSTFDLLLTDLKMPGLGGLDLLAELNDDDSDIVTVIMTGYGTVETAIEAMKRGAFDYILKPFKPEEVVRVLRRGLEKQRLQRENFELRESVSFYELSEALSSSAPLGDQLAMLVHMVADSFGAGAVELIVEHPERPHEFHVRASHGPRVFQPRLDQLFEAFRRQEHVLAHGEESAKFVANPNGPSHGVESFMAAPLKLRGDALGVLNAYELRPKRRFTEGQRKGLSILASRAAHAIETARMYENLSATFTQTVESFARALEAKDRYTHGHSDRVAMYARLIGTTMELSDRTITSIEHGGLLHDIGKIGLNTEALNKPQKLTPAEYELFKSHPVVGRRIIEPVAFLTHLVPCVYHHHEAWDGSGYPDGLHKTDIPLEARVLAVSDSYDAMTSNRPYRKALPHEIAIAEFRRCSGRQYDPDVVDAFLMSIHRFREDRKREGLRVPE